MNKVFNRNHILTISPLALLTLSACGGGSGSSDGSGSSAQTITGNIVKGPLSNALVFLDYNGNGTMDGSETSVRTDANGAFSLSATGSNYTIVALTDETTVDTSSGAVLDGVTLKAPSGASVVTPTTTLMEEGDLTAAQVAEVLNLPDDVDPLTFNPFAAGVDAADALAVEKVSQQIMTAVSSFASAAEGAGASEADAFTAALGSVIEVVKVKAENLSDETASVADKTLDFSNTTDLNLIKAEVTGKTANLSGIDADAVSALIDDTATSIKNVNDEIAKVADLDSDITKAAFSTMQALIEEVKEAAIAEAELVGSGNITYTDTSVVEAAAKNKAPSDIALSATSISELASSLIIGTASTTDSDQTDGVAFKYSIVEADGTDHAAFTINTETGELSLKEQPDYETKSSYKVIIKSTDEDGKSYQEEFEIGVVDERDSYSDAPIKIYINQYNQAFSKELDEAANTIDSQLSSMTQLVEEKLNSFDQAFYDVEPTMEVNSSGISISTGDFGISASFSNFNPGTLSELSDLESIDPSNPDSWIIEGGLSEISFKETGSEFLTISLDSESLSIESSLASANNVNGIKLLGTFSNQFSDIMSVIDTLSEIEGLLETSTSEFLTGLETETLQKYTITGFSLSENNGSEVAAIKVDDQDNLILNIEDFELTMALDLEISDENVGYYLDNLYNTVELNEELDLEIDSMSLELSHSDFGSLIKLTSDLSAFPDGLPEAGATNVYAKDGSQNVVTDSNFSVAAIFTFEDGVMTEDAFETYFDSIQSIDDVFSEVV